MFSIDWRRLFGAAGENIKAAVSTTDAAGWRSVFGGGTSATGHAISPRNALSSSAVFAAVNVISSDIGKLPLNVRRREIDVAGRTVTREAPDHPIQLLMNFPNRYQDRQQFKDFVTAQAVLNGNGVAWIERMGNGRPIALHPVPAPLVTVLWAPGDIFYQFAPPSNLVGVLPTDPVPARDVLHVRGLSDDGLWGISPIDRLRNAIGLALAMEEHGSNTFKNGANASGVLEHPGALSEEAGSRLRKQWEERYSGRQNSGKTIILEEGMKYSPLQMNSKDAQFLEGRRFQVEDIARIFRVPPQKLMHLDRMTFNNVEHLSLDYINDSLMPWLERWESQISDKLFMADERQDYFVEFAVTRLARGDLKSRVDSAMAGIQGVMTINEARHLLDLPPITDGDVRLEPLNMTAVENGQPRPSVNEQEAANA